MTAPGPGPAPGDRRPPGRTSGLESTVARLLVAGTYAAMLLVLAGAVLMLAGGVDPTAHGGLPGFDAGRIPADLAALRPEGFLWAGILLVLALPLGRVAVAGLAFLVAGDRALAVVSLAVLLVVLASILAGGVGG